MSDSHKIFNLYYLFCDSQAPPMPPQRLHEIREALAAEYRRVFPDDGTEPNSPPPQEKPK